jgi:hypothetical protein
MPQTHRLGIGDIEGEGQMRGNRHEDLDRGIRLIQQLPEVMEDRADEATRSVYEDIRATLRVPFINFIFRVLANYPEYFILAWKSLSPLFRTLALERAADQLRARALLEPVLSARPTDLVGPEELRRIRSLTDTIHYAAPKLLLVATALDEDLEETSRRGSAPSRGRPSEDIESRVAEGTNSVPMVSPDHATGDLRKIFEEIKERHGHPDVASYYRSLGNWPVFLQAVWEAIAPVIGSAAYEQRKRALIEQAAAVVEDLPATAAEPSVGAEEVAEIHCILAVFRLRIIPDLLMDVSLIKAMLDGAEEARSSRFSNTR